MAVSSAGSSAMAAIDKALAVDNTEGAIVGSCSWLPPDIAFSASFTCRDDECAVFQFQRLKALASVIKVMEVRKSARRERVIID